VVAGSVVRLSGTADTTKGARRTVAKRNTVEKRIFVLVSESLPKFDGISPAGCVYQMKNIEKKDKGCDRATQRLPGGV